MIVDLHMHSTISDGRLTPTEVMTLAHQNGVEMLSLTDHDTMEGTAEARAAAESLGMQFVPGVEVSTRWTDKVIHIVGLGLDAGNTRAADYFRDACGKRDRRAREISDRLREVAGIEGAYEGALSFAMNKYNISRTHFARWLCQEGYVDTYQGAFDKYLATTCLVPVDWPKLDETVELIHSAGGLAVIAHPGRYHFKELWMSDALMQDFKKYGGDAIEVVSGSQSQQSNEYYSDVCRQMGFLASCGSDFHSFDGDRPQPGQQGPIPADLSPIWEVLKRQK